MSFLDTIKNLFAPKTTQASSSYSSLQPNTTTYSSLQPQTTNYSSLQPTAKPQEELNYTPYKAPVITPTPNYTPYKAPTSTPVSVSNLNNTEYQMPEPSTNASSELAFNTDSMFSDTKPNKRDDALSAQLDLIKKYGEQGDYTQNLMQEQKLQEKQQFLADINARAMATDRAYEKQVRALRENPEGVFGPGVLESQISDLTRKRNESKADLAIQQLAAQGNVDVALNFINQSVAAKFEPLKNQIDAYDQYLSSSANDLTKSEQIMLENNISQMKNEYESAVNQEALNKKASAYQTMLEQGTITMDKVPSDVLTLINTQGYITPEQKTAKEQTQNFMSRVDDFMKLGATAAVGPQATKVLPWVLSKFGITNYEKDKSIVENIKAQLTLENLKYLKGAMSDKDLLFIQQASSALNENMTEGQYKKELISVQGAFVRGIVNSPAFSIDEKKEALMKQFLLEDPKATDEQIVEMTDNALKKVTTFNSVGNTLASNRPQRNNNPLNIKSSSFTNSFNGVSGIDPTPATDGGKFLVFDSPQAGFEAAKKLITAPSYKQLSVNSALRRWSGNGYGAEIVPALKNKTIAQLSASELNTLLQTMAKREGFYA